MSRPLDEPQDDRTLHVDLAIIGSGIAGVTAAKEASKAGLRWCIFHKRPGQIALSSGLFDGQQIAALRHDLLAKHASPNAIPESETPLHDSLFDDLLGHCQKPALLLDTWGRVFQASQAQKSQLRGDIAPLAHDAVEQGSAGQQGPQIAIGRFGFHRTSPDPASHFNQVFGLEEGQLFVDVDLPRPTEHPSPFRWAQWIDQDPQRWLSLWEPALIECKERYPTLTLILLPPILGYQSPDARCYELSEATGLAVAEMLGTTLSVPGYRLHLALEEQLHSLQQEQATASILKGQPTEPKIDEASGRLLSCRWLPEEASAEAPLSITARQWLLVSGEPLSRAQYTEGSPKEQLLGLPLFGLEASSGRGTDDERYIPLEQIPRTSGSMARRLQAGIRVDDQWRPCDGFGVPRYGNVRAAGTIVATPTAQPPAQRRQQAIEATRAAILALEEAD